MSESQSGTSTVFYVLATPYADVDGLARPATADDITDDMVVRAGVALLVADRTNRSVDKAALRAALTAALGGDTR